jgi:hypothetical protein
MTQDLRKHRILACVCLFCLAGQKKTYIKKKSTMLPQAKDDFA